MAGVRAERDVRLRRGDAVHLVEPAGDHVRELVVGADPDDRHQVVVPGDRVHLADRRQLRDGLRDLGDAVNLGLEQDDGGDHGLPPGSSSGYAVTYCPAYRVSSGGRFAVRTGWPAHPAARFTWPIVPQRRFAWPGRHASPRRAPQPGRPCGTRRGRRGRARSSPCRAAAARAPAALPARLAATAAAPPGGRLGVAGGEPGVEVVKRHDPFPVGQPAEQLTRARPRWPARRRAPGATAAPACRRTCARVASFLSGTSCGVAIRCLASRTVSSTSKVGQARPMPAHAAVRNAEVERRVVRGEHAALGEREQPGQHGGDRRGRREHLVADPRQLGDRRRNGRTRIDERAELGDHRAPVHAHRADLGDAGVLRRPPGRLDVHDREVQVGQRDRPDAGNGDSDVSHDHHGKAAHRHSCPGAPLGRPRKAGHPMITIARTRLIPPHRLNSVATVVKL